MSEGTAPDESNQPPNCTKWNVTLKGEPKAGSLVLSSKGLIYYPSCDDGKKVKLAWTSFVKHQVRPEGSATPALRITTKQNKTFQFETKDRYNLTQIKKGISAHLKAARDVESSSSTSKTEVIGGHESFASTMGSSAREQELETANEKLNSKLHLRDTQLSIMTKENQELWKKLIAFEEDVKSLTMEMLDIRNKNKALHQELDAWRADVAPARTHVQQPPPAAVAEAQATIGNDGNTTVEAPTTSKEATPASGVAVKGTLIFYLGNKMQKFEKDSFDPLALWIVQIADRWLHQKMNVAFPNAGPTFSIRDDYTTTLISNEIRFLQFDNRYIIKFNATLTFSSASAPSLKTLAQVVTTLNPFELVKPTNQKWNPANPGHCFTYPFCNASYEALHTQL